MQPSSDGNAFLESGKLTASLPPISWNVIRIHKAGAKSVRSMMLVRQQAPVDWNLFICERTPHYNIHIVVRRCSLLSRLTQISTKASSYIERRGYGYML